MRIKFNLIQDIYDFVELAQKSAGKVTLMQQHYTVDGKSIFGLFALDLTKEITLVTENDAQFARFEAVNG